MKLDKLIMIVGDNISTKDIKTTANSKMLEDYIPPFNATVVERLLEEGVTLSSKGSIREFGVGESDNPYGTAELVAKGMGDFGIASDTEGEVRESAIHHGLYGLKPSYGLVSRYGLIGCASSIDTIGILGKSIEDIAMILQTIDGKDPKDSTSMEMRDKDYIQSLDMDIKGMKIGLIEEYLEDEILESLRKWEDMGAIIKPISISSLDYGLEAYEIISSGEFSSNMAKFDGIGYGYRTKEFKNIDELYKKSRTESLGDKVRKKIMFGNFVLSSEQYEEYYVKAQRIRTMIKEDFDKIFKEYDLIITPVEPKFTVGVSLAGVPALSIPYKYGDKNGGIQLVSKAFNEGKLLGFGNIYKNIVDQDKIGGEK